MITSMGLNIPSSITMRVRSRAARCSLFHIEGPTSALTHRDRARGGHDERGSLVSGATVRTATFAATLAALPLYPALIVLQPNARAVPGLAVLPRAGALALLAMTLAFTAIWLVMLLRAEPRRLPTARAFVTLPIVASLSGALGFDPRASVVFVAMLACGVVLHAAIVRFAPDDGAVPALLGAFLWSGALASLAAIAMVAAKQPPLAYVLGHGRAIGTFVVPGELAGYLVMYVPVAFAVLRSARRTVASRALVALGLAIACVAFALTFSRAGWLGMAGAFAALVLLHRRDRGARPAAAIVGVAIVVLVVVFNAHHDPSENFTRLSIWHAALDGAAMFPLSGVGPFAFASLYHVLRVPGGEPLAFHAHDVVLTLAVETGALGVAAAAWAWWTFVSELRARLRSPGTSRGIALAIAASFAGTWVQGIVDTLSIVIFGLWLPFTALALACAGELPHDVAARARTSPRAPAGRAATIVAAAFVALAFAYVQLASSALYGFAARPGALPARLSEAAGRRAYAALARIAPMPFVERALADDALQRGDLASASASVARMPPGAQRDDLAGRIAAAEGRDADAIALYLAAGDDARVLPFEATARSVHAAYALERRIRDRLAHDETRPNALAQSEWRLGGFAMRLGDARAAQVDDARAVELAPLNTTYLKDAGRVALRLNEPRDAARLFARALAIDPDDAETRALLRGATAATPR